jgi:hypothetical protein
LHSCFEEDCERREEGGRGRRRKGRGRKGERILSNLFCTILPGECRGTEVAVHADTASLLVKAAIRGVEKRA